MTNDPNYDQKLAGLRDGLPRIWWSLYQGSLQAGFSERQAMQLVQAFILGQNPGGVRPDTTTDAKADPE